MCNTTSVRCPGMKAQVSEHRYENTGVKAQVGEHRYESTGE